jgi:hypothetical protein
MSFCGARWPLPLRSGSIQEVTENHGAGWPLLRAKRQLEPQEIFGRLECSSRIEPSAIATFYLDGALAADVWCFRSRCPAGWAEWPCLRIRFPVPSGGVRFAGSLTTDGLRTGGGSGRPRGPVFLSSSRGTRGPREPEVRRLLRPQAKSRRGRRRSQGWTGGGGGIGEAVAVSSLSYRMRERL